MTEPVIEARQRPPNSRCPLAGRADRSHHARTYMGDRPGRFEGYAADRADRPIRGWITPARCSPASDPWRTLSRGCPTAASPASTGRASAYSSPAPLAAGRPVLCFSPIGPVVAGCDASIIQDHQATACQSERPIGIRVVDPGLLRRRIGSTNVQPYNEAKPRVSGRGCTRLVAQIWRLVP